VDPIVFVVDDDASMRQALANLVSSVSLRVECFASSAEFLRRGRSESPSYLVLDVRLPGLSGLELQQRPAPAEPHIPIIFQSGAYQAQSNTRAPCAAHGTPAAGAEFGFKGQAEQTNRRRAGTERKQHQGASTPHYGNYERVELGRSRAYERAIALNRGAGQSKCPPVWVILRRGIRATCSEDDPDVAMAGKRRQRFVAVVDDDAGVRRATQDLLNSHGFTAHGYSSAEQLLQSAQYAGAGCFVLDMRLQGMTGLELQRRLQAAGVAVPIIYCTAEKDTDGRLRRRLLQVGAMAVLYKPFDPEQLLRLVGVALRAG
jgi:FixJ family two-component response regulator